MDACCERKAGELAALRQRHRRLLAAVLAINAAMFVIEGAGGWLARSTSLQADALDMLGDALVYTFSLYVVARSARWQASAALAKAGFMLTFGVGVLAEAAWRAAHPALPAAALMGAVGGLALAANVTCFGLLYRRRGDNLNLRSSWLCARNDLMANLGVLAAAAACAALGSRWPDLAVGAVIAGLFLYSALQILLQALAGLRAAPAAA